MLPNPRDNLAYFVCAKSFSRLITRKLINTNGNIKRIFSSVNFQEILPTEIFHRYIPMELPWEKKFKTKQKKDDVSFLPMELPTEFFVGKFRR
jgi:hypothetical protein